ncbi:hypothetical protein O9993_21645 [Vibrio lentus]|nr:hypothetical protein [Vibrio lentus]
MDEDGFNYAQEQLLAQASDVDGDDLTAANLSARWPALPLRRQTMMVHLLSHRMPISMAITAKLSLSQWY